jgi:hypothetical protein
VSCACVLTHVDASRCGPTTPCGQPRACSRRIWTLRWHNGALVYVCTLLGSYDVMQIFCIVVVTEDSRADCAEAQTKRAPVRDMRCCRSDSDSDSEHLCAQVPGVAQGDVQIGRVLQGCRAAVVRGSVVRRVCVMRRLITCCSRMMRRFEMRASLLRW